MPVVSNVVCPVCGCCCDDISISVENDKITDTRRACSLSAAKFFGYSQNRNTNPLVKKNGKLVVVSLDEAIKKSAETLAKASYPLLYGWSSTSNEAMRVGLELAEEVGGAIDNTSTICHGPSTLAVQNVGLPAATLGQIRHRADLIIYWGSNPWSAHPRHIERYTALAEGRFQKSSWKRYFTRLGSESTSKKRLRVADVMLKGGSEALARKGSVAPNISIGFPKIDDRKFIVIDVRKTRSADMADYFLKIEPGKDYEVLLALRALVRDEELDVEDVAGIPVETLEEIADVMVNSKFGIIFFGLGLTMSSGKAQNVETAIKLTEDLNGRTKFIILPMRGHFNVTGADDVFTWQTGYPFAVDYSQGYPQYNPGETSAVDILRNGDSDAALVVASDPVSNFPKTAVQNLTKNPLIVIDPRMSLTALMADIIIPSSFVGIETEGTIYRMDHVPLPLKRIVEPPRGLLSDEEVLKGILQEVRNLKKRQEN